MTEGTAGLEQNAALGATPPQSVLPEGASTDQQSSLLARNAAEHVNMTQAAQPVHDTAIGALQAIDRHVPAPDDAALQYYATPQQDYPGVSPTVRSALIQV